MAEENELALCIEQEVENGEKEHFVVPLSQLTGTTGKHTHVPDDIIGLDEYIASLLEGGELTVVGKSAYQSWLEQPENEGKSEAEFVMALKGSDGRSAYETWLRSPGNEGKTETEFLEWLQGQGGADGAPGQSAYQLWLEQPGNEGKTEAEFLESLKGRDGNNGSDGAPGIPGEPGMSGPAGEQGKSAYQVWLEQDGNEGKTETEFLESLKGRDGQSGFGEGCFIVAQITGGGEGNWQIRELDQNGSATGDVISGCKSAVGTGLRTGIRVLAVFQKETWWILAAGLAGQAPGLHPSMPIRDIAAGDKHFLVLFDDGTVWSAGLNLYGQLGRIVETGTETYCNFGRIESLDNIVQIACGGDHSIAVDVDGNVYSFGRNDSGQLGRISPNGNPNTVNSGIVPGITGSGASCGTDHTAIMATNGDLFTCGVNDDGRLGRVTPTGSQGVSNLGKIDGFACSHVACGARHTAAISHDYCVWTCGDNGLGQLGDPTRNVGNENVCNFAKVSLARKIKINGSGTSQYFSADTTASGAVEIDGLVRSVVAGSNATATAFCLEGTGQWYIAGDPVVCLHTSLPGNRLQKNGEFLSFGSYGNGGELAFGRSLGIYCTNNGSEGYRVFDGSNSFSSNYGMAGSHQSGASLYCPAASAIKQLIRKVAIGREFGMWLTVDGALWNSGRNDCGQLGRLASSGTSSSPNQSALIGQGN